MRIHDFGDDEVAWLCGRQQVITGSDVAKIMRVSDHGGKFSVFHEKFTEIDPTKLRSVVGEAPEPRMEFGLRVEPVVAQWYADRTKCRLHRGGRYAIVQSDRHPWLGVTMDYYAECPRRGPGVMESKSVDERVYRRKWKGEAPLYNALQVIAQIIAHDGEREWGDLAALVEGERDLKIHPVERDPELEGLMIEECHKFYVDHMLMREEPEADGSEATSAVLRRLFPAESSETIDLDGELDEVFDDLERARRDKGSAEERTKALTNRVLQAMRTASVGVLPSGRSFKRTWVDERSEWVEAHAETRKGYPLVTLRDRKN